MAPNAFSRRVAGIIAATLLSTATLIQAAEPLIPTEPQQVAREGLVVDFTARPANTDGRLALYEGEQVQLNFSIRDAAKGEPIKSVYPGAWIDIGKAWNAPEGESMSCKERIGVYLGGSVGIRPLVDLNSYYVLVLNQDASISVIDPLVGMTGITQLLAQVILPRPGADWALAKDNKRLYVSMPLADKIAVVDTEQFKTIGTIPAGEGPTRILFQPDRRYLWVGNSRWGDAVTNVTAIDPETEQVVAEIPVGAGHHELAFSADSRYLFVSSRDSGHVSVIDTQSLKKVKEVATGKLPISLGYSELSGNLYVVDGESGEIVVIDGESFAVTTRMPFEPGMGPLRFSPDGRWGFALNSQTSELFIFDTANNQLKHRIATQPRPYQLAVSDAFVYVRALDSERVSMVDMRHLDGDAPPPVVNFQAGTQAPGKVNDISIAEGMKQAPGEASMLVVSPADNTVYYYMEGMNAPMGNFRNYGHRPRAVTVVDRTLKEDEPGQYGAKVQLPAPGTYEVAFLLDSPRLLHCFQVTVNPHPDLQKDKGKLMVEYLEQPHAVPVGQETKVRFKLHRSRTDEVVDEYQQLRMMYYRVPGYDRTQVPVASLGEGIYEATVQLPEQGAYYLFIGSPEEQLAFETLPFKTLVATPRVSAAIQ